MFILKSTHEAVLEQNRVLRCDVRYYEELYHSVRIEYNDLIQQINDKGGQDFLDGTLQQQFSNEEINKMLRLCHPDKHKNSTASNEITIKLLEMRK